MKTLPIFLNQKTLQYLSWDYHSKKLSLAIILALAFPMFAFAQPTPKALQENNEEIRSITSEVDRAGWLYLKADSELSDGDLFAKHSSAMGLSSNDEMVIVSSVTDELGVIHNKYQQRYQGVPVEDGEYIIHIKDCLEYLASGQVVENLEVNTRARISSKEALELAKKATGSRSFAWDNEEMEGDLRVELGDSSATYLPEAEMIITTREGSEKMSNNYFYAYRYLIETVEPYQVLQVDIDASTGATINMFNTVVECFGHNHKSQNSTCTHTHDDESTNHVEMEDFRANGTAPTLYYGTQTIQTKYKNPWIGSSYYFLKDETRGNGITTESYNSGSKIKDSDNVWPSNKGKYTQAHWTIEKSWDYFKNVHGLNGTNGNGKKVKVKSDWNNQNATYSGSWFGQRINIGISGGQHLSTMDIMAHEYAHGVTKYSANLKYQGESGALNESFSDIFGTMVEDHYNAGSFDWTMGEDASWTIRSLSNPPSYGDPDTYGGTNWASTSGGDNGGVHTNSGVQNKWFYLLSQGGTLNGVTVQGIGRTKAAKIAFRNLTVYLGKNSDYADARVGGINSAVDLYGQCSNEEIQTTNAWAAVGVGSQFVGSCVKISGSHVICLDLSFGLPRTFTATGLPGSNFTWSQIPSSWTYTTYGTGNKYLKVTAISTPGVASIKVTSSIGGSDTHYVNARNCKIFPFPCKDIK